MTGLKNWTLSCLWSTKLLISLPRKRWSTTSSRACQGVLGTFLPPFFTLKHLIKRMLNKLLLLMLLLNSVIDNNVACTLRTMLVCGFHDKFYTALVCFVFVTSGCSWCPVKNHSKLHMKPPNISDTPPTFVSSKRLVLHLNIIGKNMHNNIGIQMLLQHPH